MSKGIHNKSFVIFNSIMIVVVIGIIVIGFNYQKQSLEITNEQVAQFENNREINKKEKQVIANELLFAKEDEPLDEKEEEELEDVEEETESIPFYTSTDTTQIESSVTNKPSKKPITNTSPTYESATEENDTKQDENNEPVITTKTITEELTVPFQGITQDDPKLLVGKSKVIQEGVNGIKTITYKDTYTDGKLTNRTEISSKITKASIPQITAIGIKETQVEEPTKPTNPEEPTEEESTTLE